MIGMWVVMVITVALVLGGGAVASRASGPVDLNACESKEGLDVAQPLRDNPDVREDGTKVAIQPLGDGGYVPILMVHGWTGRSAQLNDRSGAFSHLIDTTTNQVGAPPSRRSLIGQLQDLPGAAVFTFDYHDVSGRWVTDPRIGSALGSAIDCLYESTGEKVIVVTHSMGGLATRLALSGTSGEGLSRAEEVSTVINFGTPNNGSIAAAIIGAGLSAPVQITAVTRMVLSDCGKMSSVKVDTGSICDLLGPGRAIDGQAGRALRYGSPELTKLPNWPAGVSVHSLAGETGLTVPAIGWFKKPWDTDRVPTGDVIVMQDSAVAGAVSQKVINCDFQVNPVRGLTDDIGTELGIVAANDRARPLLSLVNPCFHSNLMRSLELTNEAMGLVYDDIKGRSPALPDGLPTITAPAMCMRPERALVNGKMPLFAGEEGATYLAGDSTDGDSLWAASEADRGTSYAVVFGCGAGGVGWPDNIGLYDEGLNLLSAIDLGSIDGTTHSSVKTISFRDQVLDVEWVSYEGAGLSNCNEEDGPDPRSGTFALDPSGIVSIERLSYSCDYYPSTE